MKLQILPGWSHSKSFLLTSLLPLRLLLRNSKSGMATSCMKKRKGRDFRAIMAFPSFMMQWLQLGAHVILDSRWPPALITLCQKHVVRLEGLVHYEGGYFMLVTASILWLDCECWCVALSSWPHEGRGRLSLKIIFPTSQVVLCAINIMDAGAANLCTKYAWGVFNVCAL